jgi:hypothetical protein
VWPNGSGGILCQECWEAETTDKDWSLWTRRMSVAGMSNTDERTIPFILWRASYGSAEIKRVECERKSGSRVWFFFKYNIQPHDTYKSEVLHGQYHSYYYTFHEAKAGLIWYAENLIWYAEKNMTHNLDLLQALLREIKALLPPCAQD